MKFLPKSISRDIFVRVLFFMILLTATVLAGLYLGKLSVSPIVYSVPDRQAPSSTAVPTTKSGQNDIHATEESKEAVPIFLYVGGQVADNWEVTQSQLTLASQNGINRFIVPLPLDWTEVEEGEKKTDPYNPVLEQYLAIDKKAGLVLRVDLNPPTGWLEQHPEAAVKTQDALQAHPSIGSDLWIETARQRLEEMILAVESGSHRENIQGYILTALTDQRWVLPGAFDRSEVNEQHFKDWLQHTYGNEESFQKAWVRPGLNLETVTIPERPASTEEKNALAVLPEQQSLVDFYRYCSEQVSSVIAGLAAMIASVSVVEPMILVPYGYSFESLHSASGHFALELLLESDVTGFISPVSYFDRGLGGVGGMMGPFDSARLRDKQWYIIDDTRTGVERSEDTGEFERIKGIRAEDVYEVQRRNFAMALTYDLGLIWSDPQGEGWLNDEQQWVQFGKLKDIYSKRHAAAAQPSEFEDGATLTVVVDESVNFYLQAAEHMNAGLLQRARDAVLHCGVSTRFHLFRDVVDGISPPTPVYLFLNAFLIPANDLDRIHTRLAQEQACAIWVYAPGYFGANASVENISKVTGMSVKAFKEPAPSRSKYLLSGGVYLQNENDIGNEALWDPLFYVEPNEDVDILSHYTADNQKGSIALASFPEGWTSLYVAVPEITAPLLCTLLKILEQPLYPNPLERVYYDTVFARPPFVAIHAGRAGKRSFNFGFFCDIEDQLDAEIGWYQKDSILLSMRAGETRLLLTTPLKLDNDF
ncbi:MAG: hypothetical protein GX117_04415 [Candidatus Hydrogenedentes bacterium]|jgi:hypothetical protein|nr:hypothetical protein [Candidatus Hydrogenedentota bacterium]